MVVNLKTNVSECLDRSENLSRYYNDIKQYRVMTADEEREWMDIYAHGLPEEREIAKQQILNSNQRFVVAMAKKYGTNENVMDLISEGNFGLMEALEHYDVTKDAKFTTYAVHYVRRAINSYLINHGNLIRKTNYSKTFHIVSQATNKFIQEEHRNPTQAELADILINKYKVKIKDLCDIVDTRFISIDDASNKDEENTNFGDINLYRTSSASNNQYESESTKDFNTVLINNMLNKLPEREQEIIKLVFGIGHEREYELQEIAQKLNLHQERVRQLKNSAIEKMKKFYKSALAHS